MNLGSFCDSCVEKGIASERSMEYFRKVVDDIFDDNFEDEECIERLYYMDSETLSHSKFFKTKKIILEFYSYLLDEGVVDGHTWKYVQSLKYDDVISGYELRRYYFKNLDDVLSYISAMADLVGEADGIELLDVKTIAVLAWHGMRPQQMVEVLKRDVHIDDGSSYISFGGKKMSVDRNGLAVVKRFADTDEYKDFPKGRSFHMRDSFHLMRSCRKEPLEANNVYGIIRRFNEAASKYHRRLNFSCLVKNGIMHRAMESGRGADHIRETISDVAECDYAFSFQYAVFYKKWSEFYYGGDCG